jgi:energy-coupling factor transporter transmembrane protein EcfT
LIGCTIIVVVLVIVIFIGQLPSEIRNILWWVVIVAILVIVISWIIYRHSKNKEIEEEDKRRPKTKYTKPGNEPRIGHTYEYKDNDGK